MFKAKHFKGVCTMEQAEAVAKIANEFIDMQGFAVYGNYLRDKNTNQVILKRFSTNKDDTDTHVAILLWPSVMHFFAEDSDAEIVLDYSDNDLVEALQQQNKVYEREINSLRKGKGEA